MEDVRPSDKAAVRFIEKRLDRLIREYPEDSPQGLLDIILDDIKSEIREKRWNLNLE